MLHRLLPLAALLGVLSLTACKDTPPPAAQAPAPIVQGQQLRFVAGHPQLAQLTLSAARPADTVLIELPARLVWNEERTQRLFPAFAGRVSAIRADVGQSVKPGAVLATLASPDFGQAQSDTVRAQADARLTAKALQRQRELFEAGIVARKELEQAEAEAERARAEADRALARTRLYGSSRGVDQQLALSAGMAGVVVERNLNPGQEIRPELAGAGVPALFVVTDPSTLWVQIDARESDVGVVQPGATFTLTLPALNGQTFEGRVINAADFIDPQSRTIKIRGQVANAQRLLKAEMLASARFERRFTDGVVVPATAVLLHGADHQVFVQTRPGVFEPRNVKLANEGAKDVVIASGLQAGEQVVSENVLLLARMFRMVQSEAQAPAPHTPAVASPAAQSASTPAGATAR